LFKHILLPLDGSQLAESAIPLANWFCQALHAKITLLHVIEKGAPTEIHGQRHIASKMEAEEYLTRIAHKWFANCQDVEQHVHEEEVDRVANSIVQHSGELSPDLIILSAHGEGGVRDIVAGSIAQQVIALGEVPVLLLQPDKEGEVSVSEIKKVLLPLDGEVDHETAFSAAIEMASLINASIHLVRVIPTLSTLSGEQAVAGTFLPSTMNAYLEISEDEVVEYLKQKLEAAEKESVSATAELRRGDPAQEVVKSAEEFHADLILLGTHGKSGINAFWAGSTAPKIVARTQIPILLFPVRR
jgi:nucleotide-binding universal stress UspA family protein